MPNPPSHPNAATTAFQDPVSGSGSDKPLSPADIAFLDPPAVAGDLGKLGKYRVIKLLGQGGMGFVFSSEDTNLRRPIALKVMKPELAVDTQFRERFLQEARAAAQVSSEYVVTVYDFGMHGDAPFIAMQLLTGEALQDRLQRDGPLPVDMAMVVLRQAADGLASAHRQGMTHRDIKPANLWLEADPATGAFRRVKILDFGLARLEDRDTKLTASGMIVGTPHYMAPEQASGLAVDARADLFSLGCVAYTMLTGKLAFEGASTMAVLMALANHTPVPLMVANLSVPAELSELVGKMMAKNRDLRPATADEVVAAIDAMRGEMSASASMDGGGGGAGGEGGWYGRSASGRRSGAVETPANRATLATPAPWPAQTPRPGPPTAAPFTLTAAKLPSKMNIQVPPPPPPKPAGGGLGWKPFAAGGVVLAGLAAAGLMFLGGGKSSTVATGPGGAGGGVAQTTDPIPVGILHSLTGTMAGDEKPVAEAAQLAIDEVNKAGGVLGRQLKPILADGQSDPAVFKREAEKLLNQDKVSAIFGCWTSASRKEVKEVVERLDGLLLYPVQYEGLEESGRIVYLGPVPNQSILPAMEYMVGTLGKRKIFLVGSDYVFPRAANEVVRAFLDGHKLLAGGKPQVVGEEYLPLGSKKPTDVVAKIKAARPDLILNTINGSSNAPFFDVLNAKGSGVEDIPVLSVSLMETGLRGLPNTTGDYLVGVEFQSSYGDAGKAFQKAFRERYGAERVISDPMSAAYAGVKLWARAAGQAKSIAAREVVVKVRSTTLDDSPFGYLQIDDANRHAWLPCRVGRVNPAGGVDIVTQAGSATPIKPEPYPPSKPRADWDRFLGGLQSRWDGKWQAAAAP